MGLLSKLFGVDATKKGVFASYDIGYWRNPDIDPKRAHQNLVSIDLQRLPIGEYKDAYERIIPGKAQEWGDENTLFKAVILSSSSKFRAESGILTHGQASEIAEKAQRLQKQLDIDIRSQGGRKAIPDVRIENLEKVLGVKLHQDKPGNPLIDNDTYSPNA